jgi:hypothetical protein
VNFGQMRDITLTMSDRRNEAGEIMLVKQHLNDTYRECQNALRLLSTTYAITSTGAADYSLVALGIDDIQSHPRRGWPRGDARTQERAGRYARVYARVPT